MDDEKLLDKIFFRRYKTLKKIGEGSFGKVYQAIDIFEIKEYAIKFV
jgi:serine/threonine protein kinase